MIQLALLPPHKHRARQLAKWLMIAVPLACAGLAVWFGQDANWDLRNYHWYNAYAFLNSRHGFDLLPSQTPFFYNPLIDVPLFMLNTVGPARFCGAMLGLVQGLNFIPLFMLCHAMLNIPQPTRRVGIAAGLASLGLAGGGGDHVGRALLEGGPQGREGRFAAGIVSKGADLVELARGERHEIAALPEDLAGDDAAGRHGDELQHRHRRHGLAAARLADHAQRLAGVDGEIGLRFGGVAHEHTYRRPLFDLIIA